MEFKYKFYNKYLIPDLKYPNLELIFDSQPYTHVVAAIIALHKPLKVSRVAASREERAEHICRSRLM